MQFFVIPNDVRNLTDDNVPRDGVGAEGRSLKRGMDALHCRLQVKQAQPHYTIYHLQLAMTKYIVATFAVLRATWYYRQGNATTKPIVMLTKEASRRCVNASHRDVSLRTT